MGAGASAENLPTLPDNYEGLSDDKKKAYQTKYD